MLPTYEMIGVAAPIMLLIIRVLQGLSLGGAFSGSMSYVVEHAPPGRRGAIGSVTMLSLIIGFLTGSLVSSLFANILSPEDFNSWGWRIPFFLGVGIGFVGYYLRHHGEESPAYEDARMTGNLSTRPVKEVFAKHSLTMLRGFLAYLFVTVPFYMIAIYFIKHANKLGLPLDAALEVNSLTMVAMFILIWPAAVLSDRIGRKKVMMGAIIAMMLCVGPAFNWMNEGAALAAAGDMDGAFRKMVMGQGILALILGWYIAPIPALLVEIFPTRIRYTGMALSYNFCAILGGFTPAMSAYMIAKSGNPDSIMWLLYGAGAITFTTMLLYRDRWHDPLR